MKVVEFLQKKVKSAYDERSAEVVENPIFEDPGLLSFMDVLEKTKRRPHPLRGAALFEQISHSL